MGIPHTLGPCSLGDSPRGTHRPLEDRRRPCTSTQAHPYTPWEKGFGCAPGSRVTARPSGGSVPQPCPPWVGCCCDIAFLLSICCSRHLSQWHSPGPAFLAQRVPTKCPPPLQPPVWSGWEAQSTFDRLCLNPWGRSRFPCRCPGAPPVAASPGHRICLLTGHKDAPTSWQVHAGTRSPQAPLWAQPLLKGLGCAREPPQPVHRAWDPRQRPPSPTALDCPSSLLVQMPGAMGCLH